MFEQLLQSLANVSKVLNVVASSTVLATSISSILLPCIASCLRKTSVVSVDGPY